eukprot:209066_1
MAQTGDINEAVTDIPLSPQPVPGNQESFPGTQHQDENTASSDDNLDEDGRNNDEDDVNELLDELEEPSETDVAVKQLRQSTINLTTAIKSMGSDIDTKLNVSGQARDIDSTFGITRTVSSTASSIGSLWNQLQISEKASSLVNNDIVRNASSSINGTLNQSGVKDVWNSETQKLKNLDQEHKISTTAVGTVASGLDWVAGKLQSTSDKHRGENGMD